MRVGRRLVCAVFVLAPTLVLVALSAPAHAAAGRPARPNAPRIVQVVPSSRHLRPPHRSPRHRPTYHRPRRRPHRPHWRQHWVPTAFPFPDGLGQGACPSPSPSPSPRPTVISPSPSRTTSAPAPTSLTTPPTVHPPPLNRLRRHRPGRAVHGAPAAFSRVYGNLQRPTTRTQAGFSLRLLMILVLIPCAAAAILRYASKR
jgi:hypothetical protein